MFNFDYPMHEGKFVEFTYKGKITLADVKSFCFINSLLEKVVVDLIINVDDYLSGADKITQEYIFMHPEIPDVLKLVVNSRIESRDNH